MQDLFGWLFIATVIATIVGLIKPSVLRTKRLATRRRVCGAGMAASFVFFMLIGAIDPKTEDAEQRRLAEEAGKNDETASQPEQAEQPSRESAKPKVPVVDDIVKQAAKAEKPFIELFRLYDESVLPKADPAEAIWQAKDFVKIALRESNAGFVIDTVDLPWFNKRNSKEQSPKLHKRTGTYYRYYYVRCDFTAENMYGKEIRLELWAYLRTSNNVHWDCHRITIEDPNRPLQQATLVKYKAKDEKEFVSISTPDSLINQLTAYLEWHGKAD